MSSMKYTQITSCFLVFLFSLSNTDLQAQTMLVKRNEGSITPHALSDIRKLTFASDDLIVTNWENQSENYPLDAITYLNFSEIITGTYYRNNTGFETYPNPVGDFLYIDFKGMTNSGGTISILNTEGQILKTQKISESKLVPIDISDLPKGIYLCRYSNNTKIKTVKILKN